MYLSDIASPSDVKALDLHELPVLCQELREALIESSAAVGGHVGPNLGVVELSVALHRVFDSPRDKIVFDVSHQTYAHKALTGRAQAFLDPARYADVSGFSNPLESEHDLFAMGHTSTSIGLAAGMAKARDLAGDDYDVIAVIGDGSLSGGLAFESLDSAAAGGNGFIIVVNDNDQSIAENHGGLYANLAELRATAGQASCNFFRSLGLDYRYLEAGNDVLALIDALSELRGCERPVVLHIHTRKGLGFAPAEQDPEAWHHVGPFDPATGEKRASTATGPDYAELTATHLLPRMQCDRSIVAITAATPYIMGFTPERRASAGEQFVDVGIAEEHAVTYASALAVAGAKPVLGVYGTFLQRAYDELWHDLCLNNAPATILVYGSSIFGTTDQTHLGYFDISMLGNMPGLRYLAPTSEKESSPCSTGRWTNAPAPWRSACRCWATRHPASSPLTHPTACPPTRLRARAPTSPSLPWATSLRWASAWPTNLPRTANIHATLVNPRFVTELDRDFLTNIARTHRLVVTIEDGVLEGGWGEKVARFLGPLGARVRCHGVHVGFPDRYDPRELLAENGMTVEAMAEDTMRLLKEIQ